PVSLLRAWRALSPGAGSLGRGASSPGPADTRPAGARLPGLHTGTGRPPHPEPALAGLQRPAADAGRHREPARAAARPAGGVFLRHLPAARVLHRRHAPGPGTSGPEPAAAGLRARPQCGAARTDADPPGLRATALGTPAAVRPVPAAPVGRHRDADRRQRLPATCRLT